MSSNTLERGTFFQEGKYCIIKVLGQGGFGITYLAEHKRLGYVAIKEFFMRDYCDRDETSNVYILSKADMVERYRQKFIKEAQLINERMHSGIVNVRDTFEENNTDYYVMDYIEGESLADIILREGVLPEQKALGYISKVAEALNYLHQANVNHLDIKPSNIMVRRKDDMPILIDFGVSKQYDEHKDETTSTPPGVSDGYSPIEQYQSGGVSTFSPQADIYALGATLYTLLTGETPPKASLVLNNGLPPLPDNISDRVRNAIENAMKPQVNARPKSIKEFINMLGKGKSCWKGTKGLFKWRHKKPHVDKVTLKLSSNEGEETRPVSSGRGVDIPLTTPMRPWKWWLIGGLSLIGAIILMMSLYKQIAVSSANDEVINCKNLGLFYEGLARIEDENGKRGFVDTDGKVVIPCVWKRAGYFQEGLAWVQDNNDNYGYINKAGTMVIPCQWKDARTFSEGLALVKDDTGKYGYIDKNGNTVIRCTWKDATSFSEGLSWVKDHNNKWCIINKSCNKVYTDEWIDVSAFQEGLAQVKDKYGKYGFINTAGKLVIPCVWNDVNNFREELARVEDTNTCRYGYINKNGNLVIPCKWYSGGDFHEGLAWVKDDNDDKWSYIDKTGKEVIPYKWNAVSSFHEGLARVKDENGKYGYIDNTGKVVIPCTWVDADNFSERRAPVGDDKGNYHFITKTGEIIDIKKPAN